MAKENIATDIPVAQLPAWVDLVQRIQKGSITSLTFTSDNINPANPNYAEDARDGAGGHQVAGRRPRRQPVDHDDHAARATKTTPKPTKSTTSSPTTTPTVAGGVVDVRNAC